MKDTATHTSIRAAFARQIEGNSLFEDQHGISPADIESSFPWHDQNNVPCLLIPHVAHLYYCCDEEMTNEGFGEEDNETLIYEGIKTDKHLVIAYL